jgi:hypothetical protein
MRTRVLQAARAATESARALWHETPADHRCILVGGALGSAGGFVALTRYSGMLDRDHSLLVHAGWATAACMAGGLAGAFVGAMGPLALPALTVPVGLGAASRWLSPPRPPMWRQ